MFVLISLSSIENSLFEKIKGTVEQAARSFCIVPGGRINLELGCEAESSWICSQVLSEGKDGLNISVVVWHSPISSCLECIT